MIGHEKKTKKKRNLALTKTPTVRKECYKHLFTIYKALDTATLHYYIIPSYESLFHFTVPSSQNNMG